MFVEQVRRLKKAGRWTSALKELLEAWRILLDDVRGQPPVDRQRHLQDGLGPLLAEALQFDGCLLLRAAQEVDQSLDELIEQLFDCLDLSQLRLRNEEAKSPATPEDTVWCALQSIRLRAETVRMWRDRTGTQQELLDQLALIVTGYRQLWRLEVWDDLAAARTSRRPAAFCALKRACPNWVPPLEFLANRQDRVPCGWLDPALNFVTATLATLDGSFPAAAFTTQTWVLLAKDDADCTIPDPDGILLALHVDHLSGDQHAPGGCGAWFPHPLHAAHIVPDDKFQAALRNAWNVVLGCEKDLSDLRNGDVAWTLSMVDDSCEADPRKPDKKRDEQPDEKGEVRTCSWHEYRRLLLWTPLTGRSGELALASGLKAAVTHTPLDLSRAATAQFSGTRPTGPNPLLGTVGRLHLKDRVVNTSRITEFVVADGQTAATTNQQASLVPTPDFADGFKALSKYSLITERLKKHVFAQTEEWFRKKCFGVDSYILNPLSRPTQRGDVAPLTDRGEPPEPVPLTDGERDNLVLGRLHAPNPVVSPQERMPVRPVRIVADSGLGKTTLLHWMAWNISRDRDERIPILLQGLTSFVESSARDAFLERICERCIPEAVCARGDRINWLQRKVDRGEVVFLLDALDQMSAHQENVDALVQSLPECAVLLTLRPDSHRMAESTPVRIVDWDTIDLKPFTSEDARRYLGKYADLFFRLLENDARDADGSVLTIPLLLHLLRQYAEVNRLDLQVPAAGLTAFGNRYSVFHYVITEAGGLIDKGYKSLESAEKDIRNAFHSHDDAFEKLCAIGWWIVCRHYFDAQIAGRLFQDLLKFLESIFHQSIDPKSVKSAIKQLDVITALSVFEDTTIDGLTWRHQSFFEFFAGCALAQLFSDPARQQGVLSTLDEAHDGEHFPERRDPWQWTLRFALAHAAQLESPVHNELARKLIDRGNPWVVYESIEADMLKYDEKIEHCVNWLVHRDWSYRHDYRQAVAIGASVPALSADLLCAVEASLERNVRDSGCVVTGWELHQGRIVDEITGDWRRSQIPSAHPNRQRRNADAIAGAVGRIEFPDLVYRFRGELSKLAVNEQVLLDRFLTEGFVRFDGQVFNARQFHRNISPVHWAAWGIDNPTRIEISPMEIADFPVTNEVWELFEPGHHRWRSEYSNQDDQPVLYVNWWMAQAFCAWLTANDSEQRTYRLPSEWEWEAFCRWERYTEYWWGDDERTGLVNYEECRLHRTNTRGEAIERFEKAVEWHPSHGIQGVNNSGLLDLHGNVWEWCSNRYGVGSSSCVLRGGSWNDRATLCRAADRVGLVPDFRHDNIGLRVVRSC